jgi:hypothetical protein
VEVKNPEMKPVREPKIERTVTVTLRVTGSNFSVSTCDGCDGDRSRATITTGAAQLIFDLQKLPELAAALLTLHEAATKNEDATEQSEAA